VKVFLERPIEGDWPYLWIDATYLKVRRGGRIVSVAIIVAVGGVLGMGEKFHPVPWSMLAFSKDKDGYVVPIAKDAMKKAPTYRL
jgi:hypothetical protein